MVSFGCNGSGSGKICFPEKTAYTLQGSKKLRSEQPFLSSYHCLMIQIRQPGKKAITVKTLIKLLLPEIRRQLRLIIKRLTHHLPGAFPRTSFNSLSIVVQRRKSRLLPQQIQPIKGGHQQKRMPALLLPCQPKRSLRILHSCSSATMRL